MLQITLHYVVARQTRINMPVINVKCNCILRISQEIRVFFLLEEPKENVPNIYNKIDVMRIE